MTGPKRQDIELLRLLSAFGIVWFHSRSAGGDWAYAGLVFFLALSVALGGRSGAPDAPTLLRRARRLLLPWLLWSGVYALLNLSRHQPWLAAPAGWPAALMAGTSIHLWYLPFVFLVLSGLDVLKAHVGARAIAATSAGLALAVMATVPLWRPLTLKLYYPLLQWADAAAPVLVGVFGLKAEALPPRWRRALTGSILAAALVLCALDWIGRPFLLGYAAFFLVLSGRAAKVVRYDFTPWSACTFGAYLAHSLVFAALLELGWVPAAWLPVAIFGIALALVMAVRQLLPLLPRWGRPAAQFKYMPR